MECLYYNSMENNDEEFEISQEETKHLKALHISDGEKLMVTNGTGLVVISRVEITGKKKIIFHPLEYLENYNELPVPLGLALGILDNRERFEFALEKAIEIGIMDFYPIIADFSQVRKINAERLKSKAIAAIKQCKRSCLPVIHPPMKINNLISETKDKFSSIILADVDGITPYNNNIKSSKLVLVGPEGGFSDNEINAVRSDKRHTSWNLGSRRLRAETAAVVALGIASAGLEA